MSMTITADHLELLREYVLRANIAEAWILRGLASLSVQPNPLLFQRICAHVLTRVPAAWLEPSPFTPPMDAAIGTGELTLGTVQQSGLPFTLPVSSLRQHAVIAGSSGFGKTVFLQRLVQELAAKTTAVIWLIDPKADEFVDLCVHNPTMLYLPVTDWRFNPFEPPHGISRRLWYQVIVSHMSETFRFLPGAESLLLRHLHSQNEPAVASTLSSIMSEPARYGTKDLAVRDTATSRLHLMREAFDTMCVRSSDMYEVLTHRHLLLSTRGRLMAQGESWFVESLLLRDFYTRNFDAAKRRMLKLYVIDEAQHRIAASAKEGNPYRSAASLITQIIDQSRSLHLGIILACQTPSTLTPAVLNSSHLKVCFRLGSGTDIRVMKEAMGLTTEQADTLFHLAPGEAIVRMSGPYTEPFLVAITPPDKSLSPTQDFWNHQQAMLSDVYARSNIVEEKPLPATKGKATTVTTAPRKAERDDSRRTPQPGQDLHNLLRLWLSLRDPFLTQGELMAKAGITSGSKQTALKKQALRDEFIGESRLQRGRTKTVIWEPLPAVYNLLGIERRPTKGKGGYLHRFLQYRVAEHFRRQGYAVTIEGQLRNGKAVDLLLRKETERKAIEIAISEPFEKELTNLNKNSEAQQLTALVFLVTNSKARSRLQALLEPHLRSTTLPVRVELAGDYL